MEVKSGAGTFHVELVRLVVEDGKFMLLGTVDEWNATTIVEADEALHLMRLLMSPRAVRALVRAAARRVVGRQKRLTRVL